MRGLPVVLLCTLLAGCGYYDQNRPLVRGLGMGAAAGALAGTAIVGPPQGTALGAAWGAGLGGLGGFAVESFAKTPAMGTLPRQFQGTVAVAPPAAPAPQAADTGYKPFGNY